MASLATLTRVPLPARACITLLASAVVVFLSTIPGQTRYEDSKFVWLVAATPVGLQKSMHLLIYAAVAVLCLWTLDAVRGPRARYGIALLLATLLGASLEWAQTMIPGRYGTLTDVLLNAAGAALGLGLAVWFTRTRKESQT